jgi:hypothetical protein
MVVSTSQPPADRTTIATLSQQVGVGVRRGDPPRLDEGADLSSSLRTVDVVFWLADDAGSIVYDGEARHSMQVVSWDKIDKQE